MTPNSTPDDAEQASSDSRSSDSEGNQKSEDEAGFKEKLEEIDEILEKLQQGDLELEESLDLYESSIGLLRDCKEILNQSEEKIEILKEEGEEILTEPFEPQPEGDDGD
jgi:exodeoxyribonuclease VII small subunit